MPAFSSLLSPLSLFLSSVTLSLLCHSFSPLSLFLSSVSFYSLFLLSSTISHLSSSFFFLSHNSNLKVYHTVPSLFQHIGRFSSSKGKEELRRPEWFPPPPPLPPTH